MKSNGRGIFKMKENCSERVKYKKKKKKDKAKEISFSSAGRSSSSAAAARPPPSLVEFSNATPCDGEMICI